MYGYDTDTRAGEKLAGCNTFDLTYNPNVAREVTENQAEKNRGYDDRDRYTNRADMHDTKPFSRYCRDAGATQTNPGQIEGKLEERDTRERKDGPGGD